jgi:hypothetical protein
MSNAAHCAYLATLNLVHEIAIRMWNGVHRASDVVEPGEVFMHATIVVPRSAKNPHLQSRPTDRTEFPAG